MGSTVYGQSTLEPFCLRQVTLYLRGQRMSRLASRRQCFTRAFATPLYLGFLVAFWATPKMTQGHLLFSIATTAYILLAIQFEEHDLITFFGDATGSTGAYADALPFSKRPR